jgi:hypothetical protein
MNRLDDPPTKPWDQRGLLEDALARGVEDWVHVAEFSAIARRASATSIEALRALAIGLITQALVNELMVAGDVDESGFHPWTGTVGDAVVRIVRSWDPVEAYPPAGSVAWLANTPKGDALGHAVLDREAAG